MSGGLHALYGALSWSFTAFLGCFVVLLPLRPSMARRWLYASFVFKCALVGGGLVGLLALALGAGYVWEW